jgi:hypothetical protein
MATTKTKTVADLVAEWRYCGCSDADILSWARAVRQSCIKQDADIARAVLAFFRVAA